MQKQLAEENSTAKAILKIELRPHSPLSVTLAFYQHQQCHTVTVTQVISKCAPLSGAFSTNPLVNPNEFGDFTCNVRK